MSSSFCCWCSRTKWGRWVNLRLYLFVSGVNQRSVWRKSTRGSQEALLLTFVIWGWCFDPWWMRFGGAGQKVAFAFSFLVLLKGMRTRSQSKILSCCFGVNQAIISYWADSHLESCQTSTMKLPPRKQPAALRHWLFPQESTAADSKLDFIWPQIEGLCKCGVWVDCKCMDFVTTGLCPRKWLRIHPAIRDLTCGASTGSNGTKGDRVRMAPGLSFYFFWGRRGWRGPGRVSKYSCFFIDDLQFATLTHLNNEPVFTIYFYREVPFCFFYFWRKWQSRYSL